MQKITLGGGCFWCLEAVFLQFRGISSVVSGYAGGHSSSPSYEQVCRGSTGHAEVVQIDFDPAVISLDTVLRIFFHAHDPTTLNRQENDVGTQYRSVVLYHNDAQRVAAERVRAEIQAARVWGDAALVTEISPLTQFYPAEGYHQNYFNENPAQPYCAFLIAPKVKKIRAQFVELLR